MTLERFKQICSKFKSKKVLIVGDVMLDSYLWGDAERISPEAPVPLVHIKQTYESPGGAANVALNIATLTATPIIIGVIGNDHAGQTLITKMQESGIQTDHMIQTSEVLTTVKTRVIAHNQQVIRIDQEKRDQLSLNVQNQIIDCYKTVLEKCDAVILEDYNKGLFSKSNIQEILLLANKNKIPVYVDPKKDNFTDFIGVRFFKPNSIEFENYIGKSIDDDNIVQYGESLRENMEVDLLMITRGASGLKILSDSGSIDIFTKARKVHDVSGAGDTVISTFTLADICGASVTDAATLANYAAGRVVEEVGVVPITLPWLEEILKHHSEA